MPTGKAITFTAKQTCVALDVTRGTLNWWVSQGLTKNFRATETTPGKARRFPLHAVVMLAIIKRLMDIGFPANSAQQWAWLAVRHFDARPASELNIYFTADGEIVFPESAGEKAPANAHSRLTIYPTVTMDEMKARLAAANQAAPKRKARG